MDIDAMECTIRRPVRAPALDVLVAIPNTGYEAQDLIRNACELLGDYNQGSVVLRCLRTAVQHMRDPNGLRRSQD